MKKKIIASLFAFLVISCNSSEEISQNEFQNSITTTTENQRISESAQRFITDNQIEEIGILHNRSLDEAFVNFNWNSKDGKNEIFERYKDVTFVKDNDIKVNSSIYSLDENMIRIKNNLIDKNDFIYFQNVLNFLYNEDDKNYSDIETFLLKEVANMKENSTNVRDYETFLVFTTVIKYSSKYWLDTEIGGLNKFELFNSQRGVQSSQRGWKKCLTDVLASDGASAGAGFVVGAFVAAASGPAAPFTFIGAIAAEAGMGSAWTYFQSSNC